MLVDDGRRPIVTQCQCERDSDKNKRQLILTILTRRMYVQSIRFLDEVQEGKLLLHKPTSPSLLGQKEH